MVAAMERETTHNTVLLDPDQKSPRAQEFEEKLASRIVGQERAVRRMSGLYQIFLAGMNPPNRPVGTTADRAGEHDGAQPRITRPNTTELLVDALYRKGVETVAVPSCNGDSMMSTLLAGSC